MSVQDRRVVEGVQAAIGGGVDLVRGVLPDVAQVGLDLVRGKVERALGGWVLGLLDRLVQTGVVTIVTRPGAVIHADIREGPRREEG
ncbi:MAG: hypothetical protein IT385_29445 [Deltaproteobacteria bacterium]|nr:hypothetical protein [Deltaproteobacteria bacterium]